MLPSAKQLFIGLTVSVGAAAAIGAALFLTTQEDASLASHLPSDAVLAYAEFPGGSLGDDLSPIFSRLAPSLAPPPTIDAAVTAIAAVRTADGTEGWVAAARSDDGAFRVRATSPALEPLTRDPAHPLSSEHAFRTLRPGGESGWIYLAHPRLARDGSPFAAALALETPLAITGLTEARGITLRLPLSPTPRLASWEGRPAVLFPFPSFIAVLPPRHAMERLGTLLTDDARTIAETLARTFVDDSATGMSLRHDIALLLEESSLLQTATNAAGARVFALEGTGRSAADVDRVLRSLHQRFASTRGTGTVRVVTLEGFTLETLTQEQESVTVERRDGEWEILETTIGAQALASAQNGRRFVVTTAPETLFTAQGTDGMPVGTGFAWSPETASRVAPLWPTLRPAGDSLEWRLTDGPGFVEWTLEPIREI